MNGRPVSNPRNRYLDVDKDVETGGPVFLIKNGRGSMGVMSFDRYQRVSDIVDQALDAADRQAQSIPSHCSHEEVFSSVREMLAKGVSKRME